MWVGDGVWGWVGGNAQCDGWRSFRFICHTSALYVAVSNAGSAHTELFGILQSAHTKCVLPCAVLLLRRECATCDVGCLTQSLLIYGGQAELIKAQCCPACHIQGCLWRGAGGCSEVQCWCCGY